jgi:hypothetical protein
MVGPCIVVFTKSKQTGTAQPGGNSRTCSFAFAFYADFGEKKTGAIICEGKKELF